MERLTKKCVGCFEYALKDHKAVPGEFGTYDAFFDYSMAIKRLGHYEDTGLEPKDLKKAFNEDAVLKFAGQYLGMTPDRLRELAQAEKDGRLVVLPCKVGDKLYVVGERRIIRCDICETYIDDKQGPEYLITFDCDNDCNGCPFNNWHQDYSGEWSCDGEYGQAAVVGSDIGKTVFLTREEAEAALKGGEG